MCMIMVKTWNKHLEQLLIKPWTEWNNNVILEHYGWVKSVFFYAVTHSNDFMCTSYTNTPTASQFFTNMMCSRTCTIGATGDGILIFDCLFFFFFIASFMKQVFLENLLIISTHCFTFESAQKNNVKDAKSNILKSHLIFQ